MCGDVRGCAGPAPTAACTDFGAGSRPGAGPEHREHPRDPPPAPHGGENRDMEGLETRGPTRVPGGGGGMCAHTHTRGRDTAGSSGPSRKCGSAAVPLWINLWIIRAPRTARAALRAHAPALLSRGPVGPLPLLPSPQMETLTPSPAPPGHPFSFESQGTNKSKRKGRREKPALAPRNSPQPHSPTVTDGNSGPTRPPVCN